MAVVTVSRADVIMITLQDFEPAKRLLVYLGTRLALLCPVSTTVLAFVVDFEGRIFYFDYQLGH